MSKQIEVNAAGRLLAVQLGNRRIESKDLTAGQVASYM